METAVEQQDPCERALTVEIPWDVVEKERRDYVNQARRSATVPGFRKGRAPDRVLNRHFEKEISLALTERLAPEFISERIGSMDLKIASGPYITDFRFAEGRPFEVDAVYEVFPTFELGEYRELKVVHEPVEVTDELVDAELGNLQGRQASIQTLDPRPAEDDDYVNVTLSQAEGGPSLPFFDKEFLCQVAETSDPFSSAFARELKGLEPGVEAEISCQIHDEHPDPDLAGQTIKCNAMIHSIVRIDLPELDDEFAKDVNENYKTLDELKVALRKELETRITREARAATEYEVMNKLAESHPMELPRQHYRERLERLAAEMQRREDIPAPERQLTPLRAAREAMVLCAEQVLDRIAEVEDIDVTQDEIQQDINRWAEAEQITPERARQAMEDAGVLSTLRTTRRRSKAMQLVIDVGLPAEAPEPPDSDEQGAESEPTAEPGGDE